MLSIDDPMRMEHVLVDRGIARLALYSEPQTFTGQFGRGNRADALRQVRWVNHLEAVRTIEYSEGK
jgi:hypothetical protein